MILEAVVGEELPCKVQNLYYMDHFVTFSLFNLLCLFHCQYDSFHPLVSTHL